ncbi:MAG TPA: YetF domain-containing protein [Candidatus Limnocylindria bacterium]
MFLHSWPDVLRTVLVGSLAYLGLLLFVRISGKRTLASMNAFDFVVTVALGSTLATILLSSDVALAEGLAAFATLIGLQFAITWLSVHTDWVPGLVKSEPSLLAFRGELLRAAMVAQRVTESELLQAVRREGHASLQGVHAVVLETDGSFSVVGDPSGGAPSALRTVAGIPSADPQPRS